MKQIKGQPITGARAPQRRRFVLGNQAQTSATAQRQIRVPDTPQQDPQLRVSAPAHPYYKTVSNFAKQGLEYGGRPRATGVANTSATNYRASGDQKPGGYKGNSIITGQPLGGKRVVGDGNFPKARVAGKMKSNLDIFSPRVLHEAGLTKL